jgi:hypothetical protein
MIVLPHTVDLPQPETLPYGDVEVLGEAGGKQYGRAKDGRELRIGAALQPWELENPPKPAEVRIERRVKVQTRDMAFPEMRTEVTCATVVPIGSFEQAVERERAKQQAAARQSNPPYRVVDTLAATPALARQQERIIPLSAPANPLLTGQGLHLDGSPAIRGPRAILAFLQSKGIRLQPTPDGLGVLVRSRRGRLDPKSAKRCALPPACWPAS